MIHDLSGFNRCASIAYIQHCPTSQRFGVYKQFAFVTSVVLGHNVVTV